MSGPIEIAHDSRNDVLYARRRDAHIATSREAPGDGYLILNFDTAGRVVGVQVMFVRTFGSREWATHPDRAQLPPDIALALSEWIESHH